MRLLQSATGCLTARNDEMPVPGNGRTASLEDAPALTGLYEARASAPSANAVPAAPIEISAAAEKSWGGVLNWDRVCAGGVLAAS